jgi:hypothetical protein
MSRPLVLPRELADAARSAVPLSLAIVAALVPVARPFALTALVAGAAIAIRRDVRVRWTGSADPGRRQPDLGPVACAARRRGGADCTDPASPPAMWRAVEALLALGALIGLAIVLRASSRDLGLRWPRRP